MPTKPSPYLLIFHGLSSEGYQSLSPGEAERLFRKWREWHDKLEAEGKLRDGNPLEPEGRIVSAAAGGRVVDGPFVETKEAIVGYFLLNAKDLDEAVEIA